MARRPRLGRFTGLSLVITYAASTPTRPHIPHITSLHLPTAWELAAAVRTACASLEPPASGWLDPEDVAAAAAERIAQLPALPLPDVSASQTSNRQKPNKKSKHRKVSSSVYTQRLFLFFSFCTRIVGSFTAMQYLLPCCASSGARLTRLFV